MRRLCLLWILCAALPVAAEPIGVFLEVGQNDAKPTQWNGKVSVETGQINGVEGWLLDDKEFVKADGSFSITSDPNTSKQQPTRPNGILLALDAPSNATLKVTANGQTEDFPLAKLEWQKQLKGVDGHVGATLAPVYKTLQDDPAREDDMPAVAALADGRIVAVFQSWNEAAMADELRVATRSADGWTGAEPVPDVSGDLFQAAVTDDGQGGYWVLWSRQIGGDFEVEARQRTATGWGAVQTIQRPGHDGWVAAATAKDGTPYAVWRGYAGPSADIFMSVCRNGQWSAPQVVDDSPGNEWAPQIAAAGNAVWAVWDSYRFGSYDVFAAPLTAEGPGTIEALAASPKFEAWASVAGAPDGSVWVAWSEAGEKWAKVSAQTAPQNDNSGEAIYRQRHVKVACRKDGVWRNAPEVENAVSTTKNYIESPSIAVDGSGRVWLAFRQPLNIPRQRGNRVFGERVWEDFVTSLEGESWAPPRYFAARMARIDTTPVMAPRPDGVAVVFHTDGREMPDIRVMQQNRVFATDLSAAGTAPTPALTEREAQQPEEARPAEAAFVERIRAFTAKVGGQQMRIVRGDTHRHTEQSWDGTGDGSIQDAYRYAQDASKMDYFIVTDHNQRGGVDIPYIRWRCYKLADMMHNPGVFTTFFGYERSLGYPNGHRNVIQTTRIHPSFKMGQGDPDLPKLYEYARETDSLVIPHTTGTNHGTNWYAYDRDLEPAVEIFQGCRRSYEYEGCPKCSTPGDAQADRTGYQPEGFVWRAWQKGDHLGIVSASDHGSTHYSFGMIYTPENSREAVYQGLAKRRCYGANDAIILEVNADQGFMGEEWRQNDPPVLNIRVRGTDGLKQIDIIKDFEFVYTTDPEGSEFELQWQDNQFTPGTHLYYVRVQQDDTSLAWGSPVWITRG